MRLPKGDEVILTAAIISKLRRLTSLPLNREGR